MTEYQEIPSEDIEPTVASKMPKPKGYKLLIALPDPEEMTEGGILKAQQTLYAEEVGSICGMVVEMGEDAYQDPKKFPNGPYCKVGDWVLMRSYSGTRFRVKGVSEDGISSHQEMRLINDDTVEAVVEDPRGLRRYE